MFKEKSAGLVADVGIAIAFTVALVATDRAAYIWAIPIIFAPGIYIEMRKRAQKSTPKELVVLANLLPAAAGIGLFVLTG